MALLYSVELDAKVFLFWVNEVTGRLSTCIYCIEPVIIKLNHIVKLHSNSSAAEYYVYNGYLFQTRQTIYCQTRLNNR